MPIRGLTDQARVAFPVVGKLKKGEPRTEEDIRAGKPLRDTDHFRFAEIIKGAGAAFAAVYHDDPQLINVLLPYRTVEENFSTWKEEWGQGGMKHRCDGETCVVWLDTQGNYQRTAKPCPGNCHEVGRLSVWIPELLAAGKIGTVTVETHSKNDILSVQGALQRAADMRGDHPDGLLGISWVLSRRPVKISTPGKDGKRLRREKWLLFLEPSALWVRNRVEGAQRVAMLPAATMSTEAAAPAVRTPEPEEAEFDEVGEGPTAVTENGEVIEETAGMKVETICEPPPEPKPLEPPKPIPPHPKNWDAFVEYCKSQLGYKAIRDIWPALGVDTLEHYVAQGGTIQSAVELARLNAPAAKAPVTP